MKTITLELLQMLKSNEQESRRLDELIERIEEIHSEFYQEEKSLTKENTLP
jgi:tetrahydromethanopterin S-methyltransferase subunit G